jgi:hypothetical protein
MSIVLRVKKVVKRVRFIQNKRGQSINVIKLRASLKAVILNFSLVKRV